MNVPADAMPLIITLLTLAGALVLMVGNLLRSDLVAILIMLALSFSGVLQGNEALAGFSSSVVIIIACMFIVGEAIINTGIARQVGELIITYGGTNEIRLLAMIMLAAAVVGAFMSSTATAAIFIPITLAVAEKANLNHKRFLIPLAAASLISGMMTLVATTPNIILNAALRDNQLEELSFFSFTPFGLVSLALAILFMALFGQNMLTQRHAAAQRKKEPLIDDLLRYYHIDKYEYLLRVPEGSDLVNRTVARIQLSAQFHVNLIAVKTGDRNRKRIIVPAQPEMRFHPNDLLMVIGSPEQVAAFAEHFSLRIVSGLSTARRKAFFQVVGIAELMLNPDSTLIGKSLKEALFQSTYHSLALGIRRGGVTLTEDIGDIPLKFGDVLLVCGAWSDLLRLGKQREQYLLLTLPQDYQEVVPAGNKKVVALIIVAAMVGLIVFSLTSPVMAVFAAATALTLTGCVSASSIYRVVDWQTVVMIAGMLALALAMQKTGIIAYVTAAFLALFQGAGALAALGGLFLITTVLGLFMSNTAVAVLIAPMTVEAAAKLGVSPQACAMVVAIACSSAFVSPLGSPVTMLVREPGGYTFKDFAKTGLPLLVLSMAATIFLAWLMYL